jgi:hypothetical protein
MKEKKYLTLPVILVFIIVIQSCRTVPESIHQIKRFEKDLFLSERVIDDITIDSLRNKYPAFLPVFCTDIIRVGPDTTETAVSQLNEFIRDPVIRQVYRMVDTIFENFRPYEDQIFNGIGKFMEKTGSFEGLTIITYISGFNQSFATLPGIIATSLDNYIGPETEYYSELSIPKYLRQTMGPDYLAIDAVRAWIISELRQPQGASTLLDHMIYEGMVLYYLRNSLPREEEHKIFRYSDEQLEWCKDYEASMWNYILENELLYSTDRMIISRMTGEGPFVREFGQDSPGRAGSWLGYRIFESYMKKQGKGSKWPLFVDDPKHILSESRYRP